MRIFPSSSHSLEHLMAPQLKMLFGKVAECLGDRSFLEEVGQCVWCVWVCVCRGWDACMVKLYNGALLPVHALFLEYEYTVTHQLPVPATMPSPPWWTVSLQNWGPEQTLSSIKLLLLGHFITAIRKKMKTLASLHFNVQKADHSISYHCNHMS